MSVAHEFKVAKVASRNHCHVNPETNFGIPYSDVIWEDVTNKDVTGRDVTCKYVRDDGTHPTNHFSFEDCISDIDG